MYMCGNGYYTPAVSTISLLGFNSIIFVVFHCIEINEREVIAFRLCLTKLIFSFDLRILSSHWYLQTLPYPVFK